MDAMWVWKKIDQRGWWTKIWFLNEWNTNKRVSQCRKLDNSTYRKLKQKKDIMFEYVVWYFVIESMARAGMNDTWWTKNDKTICKNGDNELNNGRTKVFGA